VLRGILLDFYGTVVDEDDAVIRAIAEEISADQPRYTATEVSSLWGRYVSTATLATATTGFRPQRDIVRSALSGVLTTVGSGLDAERLCEPQYTYWRESGIREGSAEFLDLCPVPICIVSNIDRDDLNAAMTHHGIRLPHVIASDDVRSYKPRPEIFVAAMDALGLSPSEVLHVGDSLTSDVAGANALGIPVAWVNRGNRVLPGNLRADHQITDLRELLPLFASERS
jgi:2-haloacid dehalogenase